MDIFAHTLWTAAGAKKGNEIAEHKKGKFHINVAWAAFWGVFPDLFAFTWPFLIRFYYLANGGLALNKFFGRRIEGAVYDNGLSIAHTLYNYSHSLVIWALVFGAVWLFYKRPRYELLGWALHILIDIPSHVLSFFPTPFLFPISDYKFSHGIQWSNQYFMMVNYTLLCLVWGRILLRGRRARSQIGKLATK